VLLAVNYLYLLALVAPAVLFPLLLVRVVRRLAVLWSFRVVRVLLARVVLCWLGLRMAARLALWRFAVALRHLVTLARSRWLLGLHPVAVVEQ
jgi:hypothetical protein